MRAGNLNEAEEAYLQAGAISETLVRSNPDVPEYHYHLAANRVNLAGLQRFRGQHQRALRAHQSALKIYQRVQSTVPQNPTYRIGLADCHSNIGVIRRETGQPAAALKSFNSARAIYEALSKKYPHVVVYREHLAGSITSIATVSRAMNSLDQALALHKQALEIREALVRDNPSIAHYQFDQAASLGNIGVLYKHMGRLPDALTTHERALRILERLAKEYPGQTKYLVAITKCYANIGETHRTGKDLRQARRYFEKALESRKALDAADVDVRDRMYLVGQQVQLASVLDDQHRDQARRLLDDALQTLEKITSGKPMIALTKNVKRNAYWERAKLHDAEGRHSEAVADWRQSLKFTEGGVHRQLVELYLCVSLARAGSHSESSALANQLLKRTKSASYGFVIARAYAIAAESALRDQQLSANARRTLVTQYASRSLSVLKALAQAGLFAKDKAGLLLHSDFRLLRTNTVFQRLARSSGVTVPVIARKP